MPKFQSKFRNYVYCPHCGFDVHRSTYYLHKIRYYTAGKWIDTKPRTKRKPTKPPTRYCDHCKKDVSERTYFYHKKLQSNGTVKQEDEMVKYIHNSDNLCSQDEDTFVWSVNSDVRKNQRIFVESFIGNTEEINTDSENEEDCISERLNNLWANVSLSDIQNDICSNTTYLHETNKSARKAIDILHWIILFLSLWASYFNISGNALLHLLHFLKAIFVICGHSLPIFAIIAALFPTTLYSLYKLQGTEKDSFTKFVVCPECHSIYDYDECIETKNGKKQSKNCVFTRYPNHPQRNKRKPCGALLLKEVLLKNDKRALYPRKIYCYNSVRNSLKRFLDRPGFQEKCEAWKKREEVPGTYRDIYDGKVWKSFKTYEEEGHAPRPFLDLPRHYGLLLNLDWFQPYKYSPYSVGVMYIVLLNLPREERFKPENVMLVGIIPGPHEPNCHQMSSYLLPLVDELLELFTTGLEYKGLQYYAALIGCACDLPAGRKLCGLLSFSAKIGCSKCTKEFETGKFGEKTNYGGFNTWYSKRNYQTMKQEAEKAKSAKTQAQQQAIEKAAGCRWSELMRLPYFNSVQMCIIDPLHSLYLGVAKYMVKDIFSEHCNLSSEKMKTIQSIVDKAELPTDIGRIPHKIASNFSNFTADQQRNWTIYCSLYSLKPYLNKEAYNVWKDFVEACWIYSRPVITVREVSKAHDKMMQFLKGFETWLDSSKCTPNFHMNTHLAEQILDYGSFYAYWCFPFERYNGILGHFPTNRRSVEAQLMRKFMRNSCLLNLTPPDEYKEDLAGLLEFGNKDHGSLSLNFLKSYPVTTIQQLLNLADGKFNVSDLDKELYFDERFFKIVGFGEHSYVSSTCHKEFLKGAVESFLGPLPDMKITGSFTKFYGVNYLGEVYGSDGSMSRNSHIVVNSWLGLDGSINCRSNEDRPAEILYFIRLLVQVDTDLKPVILANVRWFQKHYAENIYRSDIAKVYAKSLYEIEGPASYVPIQKIKCKFVSGFTKVKGEGVRVVIPKSPKIYW